VSKRIGLPVTLKMRHDAHYVESLTAYSSASIGRMLPLEKVQPNPEQPRKTLGDLRELTESIREKGVLEPLLVRFNAKENVYYIISGERRFHAARAAGLREVPCIEKVADDAESLEIALIENLQRKDLTPFEEAEGLARLAQQFDYTHDDIARKIGKARSSVTETLSIRVIPEPIRNVCIEKGIVTKSLLLQVARQPNEKKMREMVERIASGGLSRDEARRARQEENAPAPPATVLVRFPAGRQFFPDADSVPQEPGKPRRAGSHAALNSERNRIRRDFQLGRVNHKASDVGSGFSRTSFARAHAPLFALTPRSNTFPSNSPQPSASV